MNLRFTILAAVTLMLACCARQHDARLDRAADLAAQYPDSALALLDSIAPASLSTADRHYRDLLSIRAHDKAYHPHTSDSLILDVIDYYADHRSVPDHYPMALYYGGRVYDDLGDYPTAMKYFQDALNLLPPDTEDKALRCCVLSQYGTLLDYLRLYDEAIPVMNEVIEIEREMCDTTLLINDIQLLADIYKRSGNYDLAERSLMQAIDLSIDMPNEVNTTSQSNLAYLKFKDGDIDNALSLIRGLPQNVGPNSRYEVLSHAATIYYKAAIYDTAQMYCQEILKGNDLSTKAVAYQILLSPKMIDRLPQDTLSKYIWDYRKALEHFFDGNQTQFALNQQNHYNYQLHDREREKTEKFNARLKNVIIGIVIALMITLIIMLYSKARSQRTIIELQDALDYIKRLKAEPTTEIHSVTDENESSALDNSDASSDILKNKERELREQLKTELLELCNSVDKKSPADLSITQSKPYEALMQSVKMNKAVEEDDPIWAELEQAVLRVSPNFTKNLNLLTFSSLTEQELHTALLIKCGFKPAHMKIIAGRTSGTIVSRRISICLKMFDQKMSTCLIDAIIRSL